MSAVQQAITDGVNVINFSISGGGSPYTDPVELAFLDAFNAGISVNASAGNSGPGAATSDHGGPWVTTVGASTGPRSFTSTLHLTADGGATLDVSGVTLTNGISSRDPGRHGRDACPGEDALCQSTLAPGTATGKVVVCNRGTNGRIDKGRRVLAGGAAGMILTNNSAAVTDLESDNHYLPAIQTQFNANAVANFVTAPHQRDGDVGAGNRQPGTARRDGLLLVPRPDRRLDQAGRHRAWCPGARGQTPQPDQTTADNGPPGNLYQAIAGTSMSSPHSAGASALVKAAHPSWTPAEIKSALMTSSMQAVVKEDGVTPADAFDMGAGRVQVDRAVNPTLVFNETYGDMVAAGSDTLHRIDLNIPSIDATTMGGSISTQRTAINVSGKNQTLDAQISAPAGVTITVNNGKAIKIDKGTSRDLPDHDRRSVRRERPVPGPDQPRSAQGRQQGHDPGRVREEAGRGHAEQHVQPAQLRGQHQRQPDSTHCTATRCELLAAVGQRCAEHLGVGADKPKPPVQERRPAGLGHRLG